MYTNVILNFMVTVLALFTIFTDVQMVTFATVVTEVIEVHWLI